MTNAGVLRDLEVDLLLLALLELRNVKNWSLASALYVKMIHEGLGEVISFTSIFLVT